MSSSIADCNCAYCMHMIMEIRVCKRDVCSNKYIPTDPKQMYCSHSCGKRVREERRKFRREQEQKNIEYYSVILFENDPVRSTVEILARRPEYVFLHDIEKLLRELMNDVSSMYVHPVRREATIEFIHLVGKEVDRNFPNHSTKKFYKACAY